MVKGDQNYVLKFQVKDEDGDAINFTTGDQPTITAMGNITSSVTANGDCQIRILGVDPTGNAAVTTKITSGATGPCDLTKGTIGTTMAASEDKFTDTAGTWQFQLEFKKQTSDTITQHLSSPILVEVAEAL